MKQIKLNTKLYKKVFTDLYIKQDDFILSKNNSKEVFMIIDNFIYTLPPKLDAYYKKDIIIDIKDGEAYINEKKLKTEKQRESRFKEDDNFKYLEISNQSLIRGVNFCKNSLNKEQYRPNLKCFYLDLIDSKICSTDGRRLQTSKIEILQEKGYDTKVISKDLMLYGELLSKIISIAETFGLKKNFQIFDFGNFIKIKIDYLTFYFKNGDTQKFPQYKNVIPKNNDIIVDFKVDDLKEALKKVFYSKSGYI